MNGKTGQFLAAFPLGLSRTTTQVGTKQFLCVFLVVACTNWTTCVSAAKIFESGTLGQTGVTWNDVQNGVPATNVNSSVFTGVRFELTQPAITSAVGGHFVERSA